MNTSLRTAVVAAMRQWRAALLLVSTALTAFVYDSIFDLLHRFDWAQPFVKLACFEVLFLAIVVSAIGAKRQKISAVAEWVLWVELACVVAVLGWEIWRGLDLFGRGLHTSMNDIGETTEDAIRGLFAHRRSNPYLRNVARIGSDRTMWGYKYGPGMLFGYALSAEWRDGIGIKISSAIYLVVSVGLVAFLAFPRLPRDAPVLPSVTAAAFACALFLLPERLYHELFNQGANDIFPVMLLLACLAFADSRWWFLAGVAAGLSFVTKFSPALFLVVFFVHFPIRWRFWFGFALGLAPCIPFVFWDAGALLRNVVLFHTKKDFDPTSLYSIAPAEFHWMFSAVQATALLSAVCVSLSRPFSKRATVLGFVLLLIVIEVSYREIHGNHLIWVMPFVGLVLAWHRHGFAGFFPARYPGATTEREVAIFSGSHPEGDSASTSGNHSAVQEAGLGSTAMTSASDRRE